MVIKFISITMTKAVTCPCCKKKFLRISQHFTLRPKCTLFVKRRILSLDLLPSHRFKKNVMLKPDQYVRQRDFSDLYNHGGDKLMMDEDVACTESVSLGQEKDDADYDSTTVTNDIYNKGISFQQYIAAQNVKKFCDPNFHTQLELLKILEEICAPLKTFEK